MTSPKTLLSIAALLLVGALLALLPHLTSGQANSAVNDHCLLNDGPCVIELDDGPLTLTAGPQLVGLTPITFTLAAPGYQADKIQMRIEGKAMYMGINQFSLTRQADGLWQGESEIALCTTGTMRWRALVSIERAGQQPLIASYEFDAQ